MSTTSTQHDGGPAFPQHGPARAGYWEGMTLRDWFAGQAIHAVEMRLGLYDPEVIAVRTYALADAMLAERAKGPMSFGAIDHEDMINVCVPGGSNCDPQQVADDIRAYIAAKKATP